MEEVDNIIIHSLKQIGCEFEEEKRSLKQFGPHDVVGSVLTCLRVLDANKGWPKIMPRQTSKLVSLCSDLVKTIRDDYGYDDQELGYHQLLYPSESGTRKLLRFSVEQLPDEPDIPVEDEEAAFLNRAIKAELQAALQQTWGAGTATRRQNYKEIYTLATAPIRPAYVPGPKSGRNAGLEKYIRNNLGFATEQPPRQDVVPSVLEHNLVAWVEEKEREEEWNKLGAESGLHPLQYKQKKLAGINKRMSEALRASLVAAGKQSARQGSETLPDLLKELEASRRSLAGNKFIRERDFKLPEKPEDTVKTETEEELQEKRRKEIEELDELLFNCRAESEQLAKAIAIFSSNIRQTEANILIEDQRKKELERKYLVLKKTFDLLPDAENNIKLLEGISVKTSQRLVDLAKEWEKHRAPLVDEYRDLRQIQLNKKDESAKLLEEIKAMKAQLKGMGEEMKQKNEKYKSLLDQYRELPKEVNRGIYTRRILDIVKNVKKQKSEIDKVLLDMKHLMKEITLVTDTLKRSFAVSDELLFADAKKDELSKQAYRDFVTMDECFKKLVTTIEETGETRNTIMQLEIKIEQMQSKVDTLNVERLEQDYQGMKKENQKLMLQLGD